MTFERIEQKITEKEMKYNSRKRYLPNFIVNKLYESFLKKKKKHLELREKNKRRFKRETNFLKASLREIEKAKKNADNIEGKLKSDFIKNFIKRLDRCTERTSMMKYELDEKYLKKNEVEHLEYITKEIERYKNYINNKKLFERVFWQAYQRYRVVEDKLKPHRDYKKYMEEGTKEELLDTLKAIKDELISLNNKVDFRYLSENDKKAFSEVKERYSNDRDFLDNYNENFIQFENERYDMLFSDIGEAGIDLNWEQRKAVMRNDERNLVIAAAGTGKTTVLTIRIIYLVEKGLNPNDILAITFTNKAADEMEERLKNYGIDDVEVKTIHSLGKKIIENFSELGSDVATDNDKKNIIERIFDEETSKEDSEFLEYYYQYLIYHDYDEFEESEFESKKESVEKRAEKTYGTKLEEEVRSIAEKKIADFLFLHDVDYRYEDIAEWADFSENKGLYRPDFYLPEYDVYIEHWGINKEGEVPDWWETSAEEYHSKMEWGREQFKDKLRFTFYRSEYNGGLREGMVNEELRELFDDMGHEISEEAELIKENGEIWIKVEDIKKFKMKKGERKALGSLEYREIEDSLKEGPLSQKFRVKLYEMDFDAKESLELSQDGEIWWIVDEGEKLYEVSQEKDELIIYDRAFKVYRVNEKYSLVETYEYEHMAGELEDKLKERLKSEGVELRKKSYEEYIEDLFEYEKKEKKIKKLFREFIEHAKQNRMTPSDIQRALDTDNPRQYYFGMSGRILLEEYERILERNDLIDFVDMVIRATDFVREKDFSGRYKHVLVDEFQDVSVDQVELISSLLDDESKLFCVGDDWQSIYSFRGSDLTFFLDFEEYFGDCTKTYLTTNFRCPKTVLEAGNDLIENNKHQLDKRVEATKTEEMAPKIHKISASDYEYTNVTVEKALKLIESFHAEGHQYDEIMVLSRYNILNFMEGIKRELRKKNIPYDAGSSKYYGSGGEAKNFLNIFSLHQAKGKEAEVVIILHVSSCIDGFEFPSERDKKIELEPVRHTDINQIEEERRLFYVGMTRSKKELHIMTRDNHESPFIDEVKHHFEICKSLDSLGPVGERVTVEAEVDEIYQESSKKSMQQRGLLKDNSTRRIFVSWDKDDGKGPTLENGKRYIIKDAIVKTFDERKQIHFDGKTQEIHLSDQKRKEHKLSTEQGEKGGEVNFDQDDIQRIVEAIEVNLNEEKIEEKLQTLHEKYNLPSEMAMSYIVKKCGGSLHKFWKDSGSKKEEWYEGWKDLDEKPRMLLMEEGIIDLEGLIEYHIDAGVELLKILPKNQKSKILDEFLEELECFSRDECLEEKFLTYLNSIKNGDKHP